VKLPVDQVALGIGGLQQTLYFGGDLRLQMVLEDFALLGSQQRVALGDFLGETQSEGVGTLSGRFW
jgi:hypothetical protein